QITTEKGAWVVFRGIERGAATSELLGAIVNQAVAGLPIARRMRWGARDAEFVRPVHAVVLLFGNKVIPVEVVGLRAGRVTFGHRFHAPKAIELESPQSYESRLARAKVIADFSARRDAIRAGVTAAAERAGGTALLDEALLDEVTALVEWPVALAGQFEP